MKSAPQPKAAEAQPSTEVEITYEEFPELSALVDEAMGEIEAGETHPWP